MAGSKSGVTFTSDLCWLLILNVMLKHLETMFFVKTVFVLSSFCLPLPLCVFSNGNRCKNGFPASIMIPQKIKVTLYCYPLLMLLDYEIFNYLTIVPCCGKICTNNNCFLSSRQLSICSATDAILVTSDLNCKVGMDFLFPTCLPAWKLPHMCAFTCI